MNTEEHLKKHIDTAIKAIKLIKVLQPNCDNDINSVFQRHVNDNPKMYFPDNNGCIEIKKSPIHGNGVYAKKDIPENKIIGLYPAHLKLVGNDVIKSSIKNQLILPQILYDNNGNRFLDISTVNKYNLINGDVDQIINKYKIYNGNLESIVGLPDIYSNIMFGHILNDSCRNIEELEKVIFNTKCKKKTYKKFDNLVSKYYQDSLNYDNCVFRTYKGIVYIMTTKPIKKGSELLMSYGFQYWMKMNPQIIAQLNEKYVNKIKKNAQEPENNKSNKNRIAYQNYLDYVYMHNN